VGGKLFVGEKGESDQKTRPAREKRPWAKATLTFQGEKKEDLARTKKTKEKSFFRRSRRTFGVLTQRKRKAPVVIGEKKEKGGLLATNPRGRAGGEARKGREGKSSRATPFSRREGRGEGKRKSRRQLGSPNIEREKGGKSAFPAIREKRNRSLAPKPEENRSPTRKKKKKKKRTGPSVALHQGKKRLSKGGRSETTKKLKEGGNRLAALEKKHRCQGGSSRKKATSPSGWL